MRRYLLPQGIDFYKANLHCHSVISDGHLTAEELKGLYKSHGYSVLAYTDHEYLVDHSKLSDPDFVAITGYELALMDPDDIPDPFRSNYHLNMYARDPHNVTQVFFNPKYFELGDKSIIPSLSYVGSSEAIRVRTAEGANEVIRTAVEQGFLVSLNHPQWSRIDVNDYGPMKGLFAMEIYNYGCAVCGYPEYDTAAYDQMLMAGQRIGCLASDDNHNYYSEGHPCFDSCGGFTMLAMPSLSYENVIEALETGNYYASAGPLIEELYYENGNVYVRCSPAKSIALNTRMWRTSIKHMEDEPITEAVLKVEDTDHYIRIVVTDEKGRQAFSRAYFLDEIEKND